ncbi:MAG: arylsulfatase [Sphingobium sp.]|nr:arylsulfatase [Sphingobium sp.]
MASVQATGQQTNPAPQAFKTFPVRPEAPAHAPNIIVIMTDDVGFAASSTFGGPVPMPTYDALAKQGLRYNNFHTTAMCSPTRAALLTGRNHHRVGFGAISEVSLDLPGYNATIPASAATIGQVLKANGYDTSWFGKNHNTPPWETSPFGPFDRWPLGLGFDYFYGFNGPATSQFDPILTENLNSIRPSVGKPDYVLDKDLADQAIAWLGRQKSLRPDAPFLLYYAPGTAHGPHQAPKEWIEKFHGQFDMGWDKLRADIFRRQKAMGVIPKDAKLNPRADTLAAWDTLTPEQQKVSARMMEVYAAQLAYFDAQLGRVVDELKRLGEYDNTLILYVQGDNGASQEAGPRGTNNEYASMNNNDPQWADMIGKEDSFGGRESAGVYQAGWGYALNTPFQWSKQVASHLGGTMNAMVVSWPAKIKDGGTIRPQFTHVIDVAPTIYEAIGITPPARLNNSDQMPFDGISFAYSFKDARAPSRHREQYFELMGNRGFYRDGWFANTVPPRPTWDHSPTRSDPENYKWELYNLNIDYSQSKDLAASNPQKLEELKAAFTEAAQQNNVFPLQADFFSRLDSRLRPSILKGRKSVTYYPGDTRYAPGSFPSLAGTGWQASADIEVPNAPADGTLIAQGSWGNGWGLFITDGKPVFFYRASDHNPDAKLVGTNKLTPGKHVITARFVPDAKPKRGGTLSLSIDGKEVATQPIEMSSTFLGQSATVGMLGEEAIMKGLEPPFVYQGKLNSVTVSTDK